MKGHKFKAEIKYKLKAEITGVGHGKLKNT